MKSAMRRRMVRVGVTLLPLLFALLHALNLLPLGMVQRLDNILYDARLRFSMPATHDPRIVIVDIDEKSLAELGHWPWSRDKLAALVDELHERQKVRVIGFDIVFAEADESSGLKHLQQLATTEFKNQPGFTETLRQLEPALNYDAAFARAIENRPVVLGYYFTSDREGRTNGQLPAPVMEPSLLQGRNAGLINWTGYGGNISPLARAAASAGFFNSVTDDDGVVRSLPLITEFQGRHYESLTLAMLRAMTGQPRIEPGWADESGARPLSADGRTPAPGYTRLASVLLKAGSQTIAIPVDQRGATLVPFRGPGGVSGGSFTYISAADVLAGRLAPGALSNKIVFVGTTAPGLLDIRATPIGPAYPGVELHANALAGMLDGKVLVKPDYATSLDVILLLLSGVALVIALPKLSALGAVSAGLAVLGGLVALNWTLFLAWGLVLPLAGALLMVFFAFTLNMSFGFFVESRARRQLANLFGTYVPPELAAEMMRNPYNYSMKAQTRELTVMFCDMRGFTTLSEAMEPADLQALLNRVFSRLTEVIRARQGTIDKYMGDCVMAFWGAPVATPMHAALATQAALDMVAAIAALNREHLAAGIPAIGIGIGINTGAMCVGDMGSDLRRSYTVIGDAVNLASRLEGLGKNYGVEIVASESTQLQATDFVWQEIDTVRVKGREAPVAIFNPLAQGVSSASPAQARELQLWQRALHDFRAQNWAQSQANLSDLVANNGEKYLYSLYAERVAFKVNSAFDPQQGETARIQTETQYPAAERIAP